MQLDSVLASVQSIAVRVLTLVPNVFATLAAIGLSGTLTAYFLSLLIIAVAVAAVRRRARVRVLLGCVWCCDAVAVCLRRPVCCRACFLGCGVPRASQN